MSKDVIIINKCDEWKSRNSFSLVGIFDNRRSIVAVLKRLERKGDIINDSGYDINEMNYRDMHDMLTFVCVESITLNEVQ